MKDSIAAMEHRDADHLWKSTGGGPLDSTDHLKNFTLLCGRHGTLGPDGKRMPALVPWFDQQHQVCLYCVRDGFVPDPTIERAPDPMSEQDESLERRVRSELELEAEKEALRHERIDLAIERGDVATLQRLGAGKAAFDAVRAASAPALADGSRGDDHGAPVAGAPGPPDRTAAEPGDGSPAPLEAIGRTPVGTSGPAPLPAVGDHDSRTGPADGRDAPAPQPAVPLRPAVAEPRAETLESPLEYFLRTLGCD